MPLRSYRDTACPFFGGEAIAANGPPARSLDPDHSPVAYATRAHAVRESTRFIGNVPGVELVDTRPAATFIIEVNPDDGAI